ncbi:hypothetical protein M409DRAFT_18513 [Zasmidium cellare ATCC 36951]|uniref:Hydrophobic surface binding protein A n=1 Tax=Zasmidium cellare ATCC 36951 TaxID=1080233 RepID=A0A6A6CZ04_ZASCE|nr:uncharacterized protein M409DRAFT_18513 [Zasmidium cellare ATCC 36951]KAF2171398.1 hypothetical protein M409DRAFT_18513 [Zasmidium cellare ATCC 36951]
MLAGLVLFPLLALASPAIVKRDDASINQAIGYINGNITKVNNTLNTFTKPKDSITALIIKAESDDLTKSVNNAAAVANASAPLNDDQSFNVATAILNLQPNIYSLLDNLKAHKPQFDTAIFGFSASPLVKSTLQEAQTAADSFGDAVTPKLTATYQSAAPVIVQQIDDKFNDAIAYFSS